MLRYEARYASYRNMNTSGMHRIRRIPRRRSECVVLQYEEAHLEGSPPSVSVSATDPPVSVGPVPPPRLPLCNLDIFLPHPPTPPRPAAARSRADWRLSPYFSTSTSGTTPSRALVRCSYFQFFDVAWRRGGGGCMGRPGEARSSSTRDRRRRVPGCLVCKPFRRWSPIPPPPPLPQCQASSRLFRRSRCSTSTATRSCAVR